MRRLACLLALALAFSLPAPARALDAQKVFQKAQGSVVVVLNLNGYKKPQKFGSGFVVGDGTQVVTNFHVIEGAAGVAVRTADDQYFPDVKVVDFDKENDLAILVIPEKKPGLVLAKEVPAVGQEVVAIGNPSGLVRSLSTGIVSGLRQIDRRNLVQITAPVSQGSSGGPVLNGKSEVIGVATFILEKGQNLNFAVPSVTVLRMLGDDNREKGAFYKEPMKSLEIHQSDDGVIQIIEKRK